MEAPYQAPPGLYAEPASRSRVVIRGVERDLQLPTRNAVTSGEGKTGQPIDGWDGNAAMRIVDALANAF